MFVPAKCPSCSASIEINEGMEIAYCSYCGSKIITSSILQSADRKKSIENALKIADTALEGGDYDEANTYYTRVLESNERLYTAWYGKAVACLYQSDSQRSNLNRYAQLCEKALALAPDEEKGGISERFIKDICDFSVHYHQLLCKAFNSDEASWDDLVQRSDEVLDSLKSALEADEENTEALLNMVSISKSVLDGYQTMNHAGKTVRVYPYGEVRDRIKGLFNYATTRLKSMDPSYQKPRLLIDEQAMRRMIKYAVYICLFIILLMLCTNVCG